jgi:hypothetical protein
MDNGGRQLGLEETCLVLNALTYFNFEGDCGYSI